MSDDLDFYYNFIESDYSSMDYVPISSGCLFVFHNDNGDGRRAIEIPFDQMKRLTNDMLRHCKQSGQMKEEDM